MKLLILNCDDFGQSPAINQAVMHLLEERKVSSATIMTPAPGYEEAAAWARNNKHASIGLHLTFTSEFSALRWPSLTGHPSLQDATGNMPMTVKEFEIRSDAAAVKVEILAQFDKARKSGLTLTHADNHMGSLYGLETGRSYLPSALWQCSRRGLPFRLFRYVDPNDRFLASIPNVQKTVDKVVALADTLGVGVPDYLLSHPFHVEDGETYDSFKQSLIDKLYRLPEGVVETYIHPGVEDPWMLENIPHWRKRVWEYKLMLDPDFGDAMRDAGVTLTDYRYVKENLRRPRLRSAASLLRSLL
ncbi:polysaccharide deacetylase family protein [Cohnella candidum]|uniref:ChbG/HpnK family deacetylase n=1 Tax=Cohnella candidum TaxID=2674991 RepID=A0A3G3JV09_9BACL|nr:polysaccharide deacetylase family protein [Cohnella candidum]AYQ72072.1 ChbG/HpnK family deacetylase [Cohnella candidum]